MTQFFRKFRKFGPEEKGATTVEYSLIALLIAVAGVPAISAIAPKLTGTFSVISTALEESSSPPVATPPGTAGKASSASMSAGSSK